MKLQLFGCALSAVTLFWGCAEGSKSTTDDFGYNGTGIDFRVSPLTLDSLDDACYSFAVVNGLGQLVVGRGPNVIPANLLDVTGVPATVTAAVCASRFGNSDGGDISYVAPCDASENAKNHTVRLWVNALCRDGGATANTGQECTQIQDYVNPCPTIGGCSLAVTCLENADVPVTFNFTIMGQADQGFFDIAVNFEDIFCSAKVDCQKEGGGPLELLHNPNKPGSPRDLTFVVARACTAGPGQPTRMHASETFLMCGYNIDFGSLDYFLPTYTFILSANANAEGNQGLSTVGGLRLNTTLSTVEAYLTVPDFIYQHAVYHGNEALSNGATNLGKVYWNHAIGIDWERFQTWLASLEAPYATTNGSPVGGFLDECRIVTRLTVTEDGQLPTTPPSANTFSSYPLIATDVVFWRDGVPAVSSALQCSRHPLNGTPGGVVSFAPVWVPSTEDAPAGGPWIRVGTNNNFTYAGIFPWAVNPWAPASSNCRIGPGSGLDILSPCP